MTNFPVLYEEILKRVSNVDPEAYAKTRNFINGAVTYLSPYISRGVISLPYINEAILAKGYTPAKAEKFFQELAWREYFQRVWQAKGNLIETDLKMPQQGIVHNKIPNALLNAATGIEAVDHAIHELYHTGYMHNHQRMYTASIACNIAKAAWPQPAKWLYYHLLDGDVASNNCSWQWVAGTFSSKQYYCNQENINKYSATNQTNTFLDTSYDLLPQLTIPDSLKETTTFNIQTILPVTTVPVIDCSKPTLLYNSYNLDPLWRKEENVNRVLLLEPSHFKKYPVSDRVITFIISLSQNIQGIQLYCGEFAELQLLYKDMQHADFIFKEHPLFTHYKGTKDQRSWMYEDVKGFYPSFFSYWKKCRQYAKI